MPNVTNPLGVDRLITLRAGEAMTRRIDALAFLASQPSPDTISTVEAVIVSGSAAAAIAAQFPAAADVHIVAGTVGDSNVIDVQFKLSSGVRKTFRYIVRVV